MEEHLARSIGMELHHRVELIDTLLEEAEQKMSALQHALGAQTRAKAEIEQAGHDTSFSQEGQTLKYEQALWERVHTGLTEVRTILEDLEESERQRGLSQ
jgi:Skp family chaperone for outer membrane proteins